MFRVSKLNVLNDITELTNHLASILTQFDFLRLAVNVARNNAILFKARQSHLSVEGTSVVLRESPLAFSENAVFLGVIFNSGMNWKAHVDKSRKLRLSVSAIYRLRSVGMTT